MAHDFKNYPELTNSQAQMYYWESPHKQIFSDFIGKVVKVHDGDTITLSTSFRDFVFPLRFLNTNAPELSEEGGHEARDHLEGILLGQEVEIKIDPKQRVGKWGRLLGEVMFKGMNMNEEMMRSGFSTTFEQRNEGKRKP